MERLTERSKNSNMVWFKDTESEGMRLEPCEMTAHHSRMTIEKLAAYEDAEEQGLLLRLPCKVGDAVYKPNPITKKEIVGIKIESIFITESGINISGRTTIKKYSFCCKPEDFGETVFLTKEEAKAKLKEMEDNNDKG